MELTLEIDNEAIKNLLCCAFEGGSGYWARIDNYKLRKDLKMKDFQEGGKMQGEDYWHPSQIVPLVDGCAVVVQDTEDDDKVYTLDLAALQRGLRIMATAYVHHLGAFLGGDADAETGDVFLQCCLLGEVKYG